MTNKEKINVLNDIIAYSKMDSKILRLYGVYPILWPPDTNYWLNEFSQHLCLILLLKNVCLKNEGAMTN